MTDELFIEKLKIAKNELKEMTLEKLNEIIN